MKWLALDFSFGIFLLLKIIKRLITNFISNYFMRCVYLKSSFFDLIPSIFRWFKNIFSPYFYILVRLKIIEYASFSFP